MLSDLPVDIEEDPEYYSLVEPHEVYTMEVGEISSPNVIDGKKSKMEEELLNLDLNAKKA